MIKTLSDLNRATQYDLDMLRDNPNCPENFGEEPTVFSGSKASGYVPWHSVPEADELHEITRRHLDNI